MALMQEGLNLLESFKCRSGYRNMSDEVKDAAYHCAGIKHTQISRRKFSDQSVLISEHTTPILVGLF